MMLKNEEKKTTQIVLDFDQDVMRELQLLASQNGMPTNAYIQTLVLRVAQKEWTKLQVGTHPQNQEKMQQARYIKGEEK